MKIALWYLFALISIPFYIGPEIATNVQINAERVLILILGLALITHALPSLIGPSLRLLFYERPLTLAMFLGYFTWRFITALLSPYMVSKYIFLNEVLSQAVVFLVFFSLFNREDFLHRLARVVQFSIAIVAITVVLELFLGFNVFTFLAPDNAGSAIVSSSIERAGLLRAKGTFEHPLTLGNLVILLMPLALFCVRDTVIKNRFVVGLALLAIAMATGSRSVQAIVAAQILFFFVISLKFRVGGQRFYPIAAFVPLIPVVFLVILQIIESRTGVGMFESYVRHAQIQNGLISIQASPWIGFGAGPGPNQAIFAAVANGAGGLYLFEENADTVDNWYLSVLLASGWPALFFFITFGLTVLLPPVILLLRQSVRKSMHHAGEYGLILALCIGFASNLALMGVFSIFTLHSLWFIWAAWLINLSIKHRLKRSLPPVS